MIDAMALLHTGMYDAFAIVGTDDDAARGAAACGR